MNTGLIRRHILLSYFVVLILLSIPFWILGALTGDTSLLPAGLPIAALMAICPILAVFIVIGVSGGSRGIGSFVRGLQLSPKHKAWYVVALFYIPVVMVVSYVVMSILGRPLPDTVQFSWMSLLFLLPLFLLGAIGEETGWTAYILKPLTSKYGVLGASLILALFGMVWHSIPLFQGNNDVEWILWQCAVIFLTRLITIGLYFASGQSLLVVLLFHMIDNVSFAMFPNNGSHYDPFVKTVVLVVALVLAGLFVLLRPKRHKAGDTYS